jgi:phage tail tube protein FII
MALPRKLKNYNVFHDGVSYVGQTEEFTQPNWRASWRNTAPVA